MRKLSFGLVALGGLLAVCTSAFAQQAVKVCTPVVSNATGVAVPGCQDASAQARHFPGCTVGVSSGTCLAAGVAGQFLQIENVSTANTIACAFGVTAVLNSATSVQLTVGQAASWGPNTGGVPTGALNCIASGATTPLYIEWN